ncbi:hypothetical protein D3C81_958460 [compost metagenome]
MNFKSTGIVTYDPTAGKAANQWWVIIRGDEGIIDYYKHWIEKKNKVLINKPLFGSHISVVRGEEPTHKELWRYNHDVEVEFEYSNQIDTLNGYWWVPVKCERLSELRVKLGLSAEPLHGFHLTIGKEAW